MPNILSHRESSLLTNGRCLANLQSSLRQQRSGLATWEKWADNRRVRFFYIRRIIARALQWVGHDGDTFGYAGSYFPVRQPCHVPAHPIWRWEAGFHFK
jgi:hypothetical protein